MLFLELMSIKNVPKYSTSIVCDLCNYSSCRKSQYDRHLSSDKHKINSLTINGNELAIEKVPNSHICTLCNKTYKDPSGLWRHKKKCQIVKKHNDSEEQSIKIDNELIMILIKENNELKNMMMEVIKTGTHNNNTTHTNSHNKAFNLNFFLNETCKDAMNITDFVNSIQLQLSDLERVGSIGYVEGISNIITTNLKALDVTQRPIHCTDNKREVLYVKDENKWEKEAEKKEKLRKAIRNVANKNIKILQAFIDIHPDCLKSESNYSDQYNKIVVESFGGQGDNDRENENKIIKNIAKEALLINNLVQLDFRSSLSFFNLLYIFNI